MIKYNNGFTLIEMVIGIAVLTTLLAVLPMIFSQFVTLTTEVTNLARMQIIASESTSELVDDLRHATGVVISDTGVLTVTTDEYVANYSIDPVKKILLRGYNGNESSEVLAEGFYMGYLLHIDWSLPTENDDYTVILNTSLTNSDNEIVYAVQQIVRPVLLNL